MNLPGSNFPVMRIAETLTIQRIRPPLDLISQGLAFQSTVSTLARLFSRGLVRGLIFWNRRAANWGGIRRCLFLGYRLPGVTWRSGQYGLVLSNKPPSSGGGY